MVINRIPFDSVKKIKSFPWNGRSLFIRVAKKQLQFLGDTQLNALCLCSVLDTPPSFPTCVFQRSQSFVVRYSRKILLLLFHNAAMVTQDSGQMEAL